ncbi:MAG: PspC domain-containing protein [Phycisphaeraceae bacterium]|nr:PspC domain-containing protein [Phycisphaeraceae bacterium]
MSDTLKKLARSKTDKILGGICGGLGAHTSMPAWMWRVIFVVGAFLSGLGVIAYIVMWIFMPVEGEQG